MQRRVADYEEYRLTPYLNEVRQSNHTHNLSSSGENYIFHNHIYSKEPKKLEYVVEDIDMPPEYQTHSKSLLVPTAGLSD